MTLEESEGRFLRPLKRVVVSTGMRFHTSLPVRDIPETIAFYRTLFNAEPVKTRTDYAKFLPPELDLNISFHATSQGPGALAAIHLGLEIGDRAALDRAQARLAAAGLITQHRDTSICCYANQDKFWVTDPNGYRWEVYRVVEDTDVKVAPPVRRATESTVCCPRSGGG